MTDEPAPSGGVNPKADSARPPPIGSRRFWLRGIIGLALAGTVVWLAVGRIRPAHRPLPAGVTEAEFSRASKAWKQKYQRRPDDLDVLSWLAESAVAAGNLEAAAACFEKIPSTHAVYGRSARHQQGQVLQKLNRLCPAESNLREFIELESQAPRPTNDLLIDGVQRLRSLLELELRFEERHALLERALHQRWVDPEKADLIDTLLFLFPSLTRWNGTDVIDRAEVALGADSKCFAVRRAVGRFRTGQGRLDEARSILDECLHERPSDMATYAYVLECERERGGVAGIVESVLQLPPASDQDPWLLLELRGEVLNHERRFNESMDCFDRILRTNRAHPGAHQGIAAACLGLHLSERRELELRIAGVLTRLQSRIARLLNYGASITPILEIAEGCEQLGWYDYSRLMVYQGLKQSPGSKELRALLHRLDEVPDASP